MRSKNTNIGKYISQAERESAVEIDRIEREELEALQSESLACEWESSVGHIAIRVFGGEDIVVQKNGGEDDFFKASDLRPLTDQQRAKAPASIVASLGKYGLTQERKAAIEAKLAK